MDSIQSPLEHDWLYYLTNPGRLYDDIDFMSNQRKLILLKHLLSQSEQHEKRSLNLQINPEANEYQKCKVLDLLSLQLAAHLSYDINLISEFAEMPLRLMVRIQNSLISFSHGFLHIDPYIWANWDHNNPLSLYSLVLYHIMCLQTTLASSVVSHPFRNFTPIVAGLAEIPDSAFAIDNRMDLELIISRLKDCESCLNHYANFLEANKKSIKIYRPVIRTFSPFLNNVFKICQMQLSDNFCGQEVSRHYILAIIHFALGRHLFHKGLIPQANNHFLSCNIALHNSEEKIFAEIGLSSELLNSYRTACNSYLSFLDIADKESVSYEKMLNALKNTDYDFIFWLDNFHHLAEFCLTRRNKLEPFWLEVVSDSKYQNLEEKETNIMDILILAITTIKDPTFILHYSKNILSSLLRFHKAFPESKRALSWLLISHVYATYVQVSIQDIYIQSYLLSKFMHIISQATDSEIADFITVLFDQCTPVFIDLKTFIEKIVSHMKDFYSKNQSPFIIFMKCLNEHPISALITESNNSQKNTKFENNTEIHLEVSKSFHSDPIADFMKTPSNDFFTQFYKLDCLRLSVEETIFSRHSSVEKVLNKTKTSRFKQAASSQESASFDVNVTIERLLDSQDPMIVRKSLKETLQSSRISLSEVLQWNNVWWNTAFKLYSEYYEIFTQKTNRVSDASIFTGLTMDQQVALFLIIRGYQSFKNALSFFIKDIPTACRHLETSISMLKLAKALLGLHQNTLECSKWIFGVSNKFNLLVTLLIWLVEKTPEAILSKEIYEEFPCIISPCNSPSSSSKEIQADSLISDLYHKIHHCITTIAIEGRTSRGKNRRSNINPGECSTCQELIIVCCVFLLMRDDFNIILPSSGEASNLSEKSLQWNLPVWPLVLTKTGFSVLLAPINFLRAHIHANRILHNYLTTDKKSDSFECFEVLQTLRDLWIGWFSNICNSSIEGSKSDQEPEKLIPNSWSQLTVENLQLLVTLLLLHFPLETEVSDECVNITSLIIFMAHGTLSALFPSRMTHPTTWLFKPSKKRLNGTALTHLPDSDEPMSPDDLNISSPPQLVQETNKVFKKVELSKKFEFYRSNLNYIFKDLSPKIFSNDLWNCKKFPECVYDKLSFLSRNVIQPIVKTALSSLPWRPDWTLTNVELDLAVSQNGPIFEVQEGCVPFEPEKRLANQEFSIFPLNHLSILRQLLEAASSISACFVFSVPDEFFNDRIISVMVYCCQCLGLVSEAIVLCQFAPNQQLIPLAIELCRANNPHCLIKQKRLPISSRELCEINNRAIQASVTSNGPNIDDRTLESGVLALDKWLVYIYDLSILEELIALESIRGNITKRNLIISALQKPELNVNNSPEILQNAYGQRKLEFLSVFANDILLSSNFL